MGVRVRIPATTANLGPGFDTFGMALSLYNTLEVDWGNRGLQISATGNGTHLLPTDETNTVYLAIKEVFAKTGKEVLLQERGLTISIHNQVPVTRGLGSSATAIVGGLWAANELLGYPLSETELVEMAVKMEGHPDNVTSAVYGGIVVSGLLDHSVYVRRFSPPSGMKCVVAVPDFQLATRTSRNALPSAVPYADAIHNLNRASMMVAALADGDLHMFCSLMEDKLHELYRMPLVPGSKEAIARARQAGALSAVLSGSGPSLIAFCESDEESIGEAMQEGFRNMGVEAEIYRLTPVEQGVASLSCIS
jgi:homoserine kinase